MLIDTHTHLFLDHFSEDIDEVISSAKSAGVQKFFLPNIDFATTMAMLQLTEKYPDACYPMMGLHPCSVKKNWEEELQHVFDWHKKKKFLAVGEIGIDLHWDNTFIKEQKQVFKQQIALAKELKLPIVIHVRESFNEVFEIVDELNDNILTGIFHCFTGNLEQANKIINYGGFKLGIGGVLTFKNSGLDKTIEQVDIKHLVLETDSPYLTPVPHRGKRNESAYLKLVAEKLAEIKRTSFEEIAEITTDNAKEIFQFD